jgi:glucose/arabinose dehydrogenase
MTRAAAFAIVLAVVAAPPARALELQRVVSGLGSGVVALTHAGDGSGRLFITMQDGRVLIHDGTRVLPTSFLDIRSLVRSGGEQGLLSVAFQPGYATNGRFYVYYNRASDGDVVIARYGVSANPNLADAASAEVLLIIEHSQFSNHNGGQLQFGPDGYLYAAPGDGGGGGDPLMSGQSIRTWLGKILRIDVSPATGYAVPPTNPFASNPDGTIKKEIWAYGLRNPWRFTFDRATGDLFIADVGQNAYEEVNFQPAGTPGGQNYGWNIMEGAHCYPPPGATCSTVGLTLPILEYDHSLGCSITGGYRYRGQLFQALLGNYFYGDFCSGRIWAATFSGTWTSGVLLDTTLSISTFGQDQAGELYVADIGGTIYRIASNTYFHTLAPCRVADTRGAQAPALAANTTRTFSVAGACGVPADSGAVAAEVTVVGATDLGNLRLFPTFTAAPLASTINFAAGRTRANNAILSLGDGGRVSVRTDMAPGSTGTVDFLIDVYGYFR